MWGSIVSGTQTTLEEAMPNIRSHMYELCEKGPGPMSNLRVRECRGQSTKEEIRFSSEER